VGAQGVHPQHGVILALRDDLDESLRVAVGHRLAVGYQREHAGDDVVSCFACLRLGEAHARGLRQ